ncbi:hypothetical protein [Aerolutibacter ruishenii]|uniref:hypothetical protein n=1 Tax=Aerolutibacter ruishenii TaxID=686800 RepID=UPI0011A1E974|nr:hypothetical protein [Lysobacter ruishenii]
MFTNSGFDVGYYRRRYGFDTEVGFKTNGWSYTVISWEGGESNSSNSYGVFVARQRTGPGTTFECKGRPNFGTAEIFFSLAGKYAQDN